MTNSSQVIDHCTCNKHHPNSTEENSTEHEIELGQSFREGGLLQKPKVLA